MSERLKKTLFVLSSFLIVIISLVMGSVFEQLLKVTADVAIQVHNIIAFGCLAVIAVVPIFYVQIAQLIVTTNKSKDDLRFNYKFYSWVVFAAVFTLLLQIVFLILLSNPDYLGFTRNLVFSTLMFTLILIAGVPTYGDIINDYYTVACDKPTKVK